MKTQAIKNELKKLKPIYKIYRSFIDRITVPAKPVEIPEIQIKRNDILSIAKEFTNAHIFIETGTFMGDTIEFFKNTFTQLYSIELSKELAERAIKRFKDDTNVKIVQGNSSEELETILKEIDTPCVFWLDGHYSTEFWVGDEYIITAKGDKNTPILRELIQIVNHAVRNHIILIDDARLFVGRSDYPSIAKLKKFVSKKLPRHGFEVKNDIIRLLPKS